VVATSHSLAFRADRDGPNWRVARLDALTGITITALVHWFLLHPLNDFHGLLWASDNLVHIIVPVLVVLGWLMFGPRRRISVRVVVLGLVWPSLWLLHTLVAGRITGWYPYFFLDLGQTRPGGVALYCVAILILLFVVSCLFWIGDRWLPGRTPRRAADVTSRPTLLGCGLHVGSDNPSLVGCLALSAPTNGLPERHVCTA
jgi:hypothetical protein